MKKLISSLFKYHLIPVLIAGVLTSLIFILYVKFKPWHPQTRTKTVSGTQAATRGAFANFWSEQVEIELAGSLKNPHDITLFGSSEMGEMPYSPYYFLPDSLNMPVIGFGHAFHQDFSMFCEMLAMQQHLPKAKVCIILSPGWFETDGTNIEAFLEFARPGFLKSIIYNDRIPMKYKMEIGRYVAEHYDEIDQPGEYLSYFRNLYLTRKIPLLNREMAGNKAGITKVNYEAVPAAAVKPVGSYPWEAGSKRIQQAFVSSIHSNHIYVNDTFFKNELLNKRGYKKGNTDPIEPPADNREFQDFLLLVELLKANNCDAVFVIQPLHPLYYNGLENYNETISGIEKVLKQNKFPYLNMFVTDPKKYEPGTLNDVMHLGDYGWMKVNRFLFEKYR